MEQKMTNIFAYIFEHWMIVIAEWIKQDDEEQVKTRVRDSP